MMTGEPESGYLHLLPFGIPTLVIAEDPQLLAAAAATYAYWRAEAPFADPALELRLETGSASSSGVCLDIKVEGSRLKLAGGAANGSADLRTGKAHAVVRHGLTGDALADVADTLLLFLLARRARTPVHASAFMLGDRAVLLTGPSGSGKSTLALAAAQLGHPVLSDDIVFIQREPDFAIWGLPRPIHVFAHDAPPGEHSTRLRNGKRKAAIAIVAPEAQSADDSALIVLQRGNDLALSPIEQADAVETLMSLEPGFDLLERESRAAAEELASRGAWRLTLSDDPHAAIEFLTKHLPVR
jgi:hypothetical protein